MDTKIVRINEETEYSEQLSEASEIILAGGTVVFPTETVYGLGADALNVDAVRAIFAAKGRPADNPLIVHIWDRSQLDALCEPTETALRLMDRFWPGPLTVLCRKKQAVPECFLTAVLLQIPTRSFGRLFYKK